MVAVNHSQRPTDLFYYGFSKRLLCRGRSSRFVSSYVLCYHPALKNRNDIIDLFVIQRSPLGNEVPFFQTTATAGCSCMLRHKNRVSPHRRLFSVVLRSFWRNAVKQKLLCVLQDPRKCFFLKITLLIDTETKAGTEPRFLHCQKQIIEIAHSTLQYAI